MWLSQPALKPSEGKLMYRDVKSLFESKEKGWRATKTNWATHNILHVVILQSQISNRAILHEVSREQYILSLALCEWHQLPVCCCSDMGLNIFLGTKKPRDRRTGEQGSVIVMCHTPHRASHSGYGWGQRCNRGSASEAKCAGVICTELFAVRWKQLGETGDLIRFQSKHSSAGSRGLSPNIVANYICLHFPQLTVRHRWKRNLDGTGTIILNHIEHLNLTSILIP